MTFETLLTTDLINKKGLDTCFVTSKDIDKIGEKNKSFMELNNFKGDKNTFNLTMDTLFVGTEGIKEADDWRQLGFELTRFLNSKKIAHLNIFLPNNSADFVEGMVLGTYSFNKYKSQPEKERETTVYFIVENKDQIIAIDRVTSLVKSQFITRDLVNTTPEDANSETILNYVIDLFSNSSVKVEPYYEKDLKEFGMNGHLAVNRASRHKALTIKLTYIPNTEYNNTHVFIGKGLTYDSGGLSLKPSSSMTTMKMDKAGAMTLIGLFDYLKQFGSRHKVVGYLCLAENMIDGSAYKPDDILTMMNGKTVHIKNTDAEGRLVLFDNICLAQSENKNITTIHTLATLTGAAVVQFGAEAAGLVGFNEKLKAKVKKSGEKMGEIFMNAEFHKYMMDGVNDSIADISNTGTKNMGCQKAGLFLTHALNEENKDKFVHWDIAGPAYTDKKWGTNIEGATGFGVRTLVEFLK